MMATREEVEETARLILMDNPSGPKEFASLLRAEFEPENMIAIETIAELWRKYRGMDGHIRPTHSIETGLAL